MNNYTLPRETAAFGGVSLALWGSANFGASFGKLAAFLLKKKQFGAPMAPQMVLKLPQSHEDSEHVLSFEIGQREGGFCKTRTDPPSTVF